MATVKGTNGPDMLDYAAGVTDNADTIYGNLGADTIYGRDGDDMIKGGGGADTINGGFGLDTALYVDSDVGVTVRLDTGQGFSGTAAGDTLFSIERVYGSYHNDILIGNDWSNGNVLSGLDGDDLLKGCGGSDVLDGGNDIDTASYYDAPSSVVVDLTTGSGQWGDAQGDILYNIENVSGSAYGDFLYGNSDANVLQGVDGNDHLWGLDGADTLYGGAQNDELWGEGGVDTLYGGTGTDTMYGGTENDFLYGESEVDWLYGQDGNDLLNGGAGNDNMDGGAGNDDYYVDSLGEVITEGATIGVGNNDNDRVFVTIDNYVLTAANVESLLLVEGSSAITATGSNQNNTIIGNGQHNVINGGGNGAIGGDSLTGGGGNDTFVFNAGQAQGDTVYDFTGAGVVGGDVLQFVGYGPGAWLEDGAGNDFVIHSGDGLTNETITLVNVTSLDVSDYAFI
jgi:Ca2+-binding RTX toxin-like protein